jgi:DNA-binding NarL/FixJ family response regulator
MVVEAGHGARATIDARRRRLDSAVASPSIILVDPLSRMPIERLADGPVHAVLPRDADGDELVATVQAVALGLLVVDESLLSRDATSRTVRAGTAGSEGRGALTARERDVLDLIAAGMGTKQIAGRLALSVHTIKTHVESIFQKLGVRSRAEAVAIGAREGLVEL